MSHSQRVHQKQIQLLFRQRRKTATKRSNFWHNDLRDNYESAFYLNCVMPIPGKTFQTSYILAINKTVKQQKPQIQTFSTLTTHWTTKTPQNVLKMFAVSPETSREIAMLLTDSCNG